jgi:hypothetical protein
MDERPDERGYLADGMACGLLAGLVFGLVELVAAWADGHGAGTPLRYAASLITGRWTAPISTIVVVGAIAHLALSALYGAGFAWFRGLCPTRAHFGREALLGLCYGLLIWELGSAAAALGPFPWFLAARGQGQALLHGLGFGVPLALLVAKVPRRA